MRKSDYPDYKKHEREHLVFANEFHQLRQEIGRGEANEPALLVRKMATWILNHIYNTDRALAAHLRKKSIR
jgi:hemerythrin